MAQVIADIREVFDAKGRVGTVALLLVPLREVAVLNDRVPTGVYVDTRETAVLGDNTDYRIDYDMRETAVLSDQVITSNTQVVDLRESAQFGDAPDYVVRHVAEVLREVADFNDAIDVDTVFTADLRESASLLGNADFRHVRRTTLRETAELNDVLHDYSVPQDIRESAELGDTLSTYIVFRADIRESAVIQGNPSALIGHATDIKEVAQLGDRVSSFITRVADIRETAYLEDGLDGINTVGTVPAGTHAVELADTDGWTANVENWALSEYRQIPINQQVGQFGFGPGGTHIPGGTEGLAAYIETGAFELAKNAMETRLTWVWFEGEMSDDIKLKVTTRNVKEREASHEYDPWDDVHSDVQKFGYKIGRGLRGRRWMFRMMSTSDVSFSLQRILVARVNAV